MDKTEGLSKTALSSIKKARRASRETGLFIVEIDGLKVEITFNLVRMCSIDKLVVNNEEIDVYDLGWVEDLEPSRDSVCGFRQFTPYSPEDCYLDKTKFSDDKIVEIGLIVAEAAGKYPIYYDTLDDIPKLAKKKKDIIRQFILKSEGVELEITRSPTEYCMIDNLVLNGCQISIFDLGAIKDVAPGRAKGCGCGHRKFIPHSIAKLQMRVEANSLDEMIAAGKALERMIDYQDCPCCR